MTSPVVQVPRHVNTPPVGVLTPSAAVLAVLTQTQLSPSGMLALPEHAFAQALHTPADSFQGLMPVLPNLIWAAQQPFENLSAVQQHQENAGVLPLVAGLYLAERLIEAGQTPPENLYAIVSPINRHPHPLVQIYLAGLYRHLDAPQAFGPLLGTLMRDTFTPRNPNQPPTWDVAEEVGGTLLQLIANRTAKALTPPTFC